MILFLVGTVGGGNLPVPADLGRPAVIAEKTAGRNCPDTLEERILAHRGLENAELLVQFWNGVHQGQEALDLRSEGEADVSAGSGVVEGLLPHPVAGQEQFLAVPEREGEHADEAVQALLTPLLVGVDDDFGVGLGSEPVAGLQLLAQLFVVEDHPIENQRDGAVLVGHGLLAGFQVDDLEAPVPQRDRPQAPDS